MENKPVPTDALNPNIPSYRKKAVTNPYLDVIKTCQIILMTMNKKIRMLEIGVTILAILIIILFLIVI